MRTVARRAHVVGRIPTRALGIRHAPLAAVAALPPASPRSPSRAASSAALAQHLASNVSTAQDAQDLAIAYGVGANGAVPDVVRPIAVVKVGGEVITKDAANLVASLKFLAGFGLQVRRPWL